MTAKTLTATPIATNVMLTMALQRLQDDVWQTAENSGWHEVKASLAERIALIHSEASEALEEVRNGHAPDELYWRDNEGTAWTVDDFTGTGCEPGYDYLGKPMKTEGVGAEFADIIIRILDAAGEHHIPVIEALIHKAEYNKTRPYRHGGKTL